MSIVNHRTRVVCAAVVLAGLSGTTSAQDMTEGNAFVPMSREGSGTSWQPDASPMYALHGMRGAWELMGHGNLFLQYLRDERPRGYEQTGSINWFMGMARRPIGAGRLGFKAMMSLEALTIAGCGYPDLLASGETCEGDAIVDRQHPHDLFMEAALTWESPSARGLGLQIYAGAVGEPALGPVAYPHRISSFANPIAPISHHWLDASHITFGVVTVGLHGSRWKTEGSVFNGREPDEHRYDFDLGPLDSYSGRVWLLPNPRLALQVSAGRLKDAEPGGTNGHPDPHSDGGHAGQAPGNARVTVDRFTASATYHRPLGEAPGIWATTVAWGRNREAGASTDFVLAETTVNLGEGHALFGRADAGRKDAHDLHLDELEGVFTLGKLQVGYVRYLGLGGTWRAGLGGTVTASVIPGPLQEAYGGRTALGMGLFLNVRPRGMMMGGADPHAGHQH